MKGRTVLQLLNNDSWSEIDRREDSYNLVVVLRDDNGRLAFFKYKARTEGPLAANERIAYQLGCLLNLPVAEVQLMTWEGMEGCLSHCVPGLDPVVWQLLPPNIRHDIPKYFSNGEKLKEIGVFDVWICNTDRHAGNLMFSRRDDGRYALYAIDHGHGLIGCRGKFAQAPWTDDYWFNAGLYLRLPEIRDSIRSFSEIDAMVSAVERIEDQVLNETVDGMPHGYIENAEVVVNTRLLKTRRDRLREMMKNWCDQIAGA